jgi:hypothetical protein
MDKLDSSLIAAARSAKVRFLALSELDPEVDEILRAGLAKSHRLDGAVANDGGIAVLAFRVPREGEKLLQLRETELSFFPFAWCLTFGAALTVTAFAAPKSKVHCFTPRVFLRRNSPVLRLMRRGIFRCVLYCAEQPRRICEVEFGPRVSREVDNIQLHSPKYYWNEDALFWEIVEGLRSNSGWSEYMLPEERLSVGWQSDFRGCLRFFTEARATLLEHCDYTNYAGAQLPPAVMELFEACSPSHFSIESVASFASTVFASAWRFYELATAGDAIAKFAGPAPGNMPSIAGLAVQIALRAPQNTDCGRKVIWIGGQNSGVGYHEPDPASFPKHFNAEEYWRRLPYNYPHWGLGALVARADIPVELRPELQAWASFPSTEPTDKAETLALADTLLEEAVSTKAWVIPPRAIVQIPIGPFTHFEVSEFKNEVFFVGRTARGEFAILLVEIDKKALVFPELDLLGIDEVEKYESVEAALKLLLAAIIRDFWVVENRDSVFAAKTAKRLAGIRQVNNPDGSPRIVYLPRIQYQRKPDTHACAESLDHKERSAHFVREHFRKVAHPSNFQIILAERYGLSVPEGYTFVRPHERGTQRREVVYRSRSALQSLYRVDHSAPAGEADWFRFEKDVEAIMTDAGFQVQHRAAAKNGDSGVDLYATKGDDLDAINWIIQCKCYTPTHKVGPDKVRELHGALAAYPRGTRGMLVTTSSYTDGARTAAVELDIRLMDGDEFARRAGQRTNG